MCFVYVAYTSIQKIGVSSSLFLERLNNCIQQKNIIKYYMI